MNDLVIYTDGSAYTADQSGGWAWWSSETFFDSGFAMPATNNQMEIMAVLYGLRAHEWHGRPVTVVSDSAYVVNCMTQQWYVKWRSLARATGEWRAGVPGNTRPVANQDLWEELLTVVENYPVPITWVHCRGHGRGDAERQRQDAPYKEGNAKADELAGKARKNGVSRMAPWEIARAREAAQP